jgi:hypothetical protein
MSPHHIPPEEPPWPTVQEGDADDGEPVADPGAWEAGDAGDGDDDREGGRDDDRPGQSPDRG